MADDRSTEIHELSAQLQTLQHPAVWGVGLLLTLLFWFGGNERPDSHPDADQAASEDAVETPMTASIPLENQFSQNSAPNFSSLLTDPMLAQFGVNGTENVLQLGLLNSLLTSPVVSPTATTNPNLFSTASMDSNEEEDSNIEESSSTESASTRPSAQFSRATLRPFVNRSRQEGNKRGLASVYPAQSTTDRQSKPQNPSQRNLWQVDFSTNSATNAENSALTNLSGPSANSGLPGASSLLSRPIDAAGMTATSSAASPTTSSTSSASPSENTTPPAFRTSDQSPYRFSGSSGFRTQNSSQIIQTFEAPTVAPNPSD